MTDPVLAQLAALKGATANALKDKWRALFDTEPPPYNRRFLESRLAYRIQELALWRPEEGDRRAAPGAGKAIRRQGQARGPRGGATRLPIAGPA